MIAIKLDSKLPANAVSEALSKTMWDNLGSHHMAIVEVRVTERTEPVPGEADESAKVRVSRIEFAADTTDDELLRKALRDRWEARTSAGTLQEEGAWRAAADPSVGFHVGLNAFLADQGSLGGYETHAELLADGSLAINVSTRRAKPAKR